MTVARPNDVRLAPGLMLALLAAMASPLYASAQSRAADQNVALAYEGFTANGDGSHDLWFGYYNRNWDREFDIPIGPDNNIEPGGPDVGQPTHFFPRRNQFVFGVRVPPEFGEDDEVVWTLTSNGVTERAYGTLRHLSAVDEVVMAANFGAGGVTGFNPALEGNEAPVVHIEGKTHLSTKVGQDVELSAIATDDDKPGRRGMSNLIVGQSHFVPNSATGLRMSWYHYRGPGKVTFESPQTKVWEDRRDGGNSPWSAGWQTPPVPTDNRWITRATFDEPGTYVIRALAHDGGLIDYEDVTVEVTH